MRCIIKAVAAMVVTGVCAIASAAGVIPFDKLSPEAQNDLIVDWTFQAGNVFDATKVANEIKWAKEAAERIVDLAEDIDLSDKVAQLDDLQKKLDAEGEKDYKALYFEVRKVKREIVFSNPLLDFDSILMVQNPYPKGKPRDATDEWSHEARHRNGYMACDGGKILVIGLNPREVKKDVVPELKGAFWRQDLSFDGKEILFCYRPVGEKSFHLYKVNADGTNLRQLTRGDYDDLDPVYTPDGHIVFASSRQGSYVRCMPMTHAFAMSRCDSDGKNIYVISANGEPEYMPNMLPDGRVIFTRWEYTDKALWRVQSLWTMNPDGTNPQTFWGNQSVWPDVLTEARPIPDSKKVVFIGLGHHAWFNGSVGYIDPTKGMNYPDGLERITREVAWAEVGNGPQDPAPSYDYHTAGAYFAYKTPYPLSEEYMLVSARVGKHLSSGSDHGWFFKLYFQDVYGNKELIYAADNANAWYAMPFKPRPVPTEIPDKVDWPKIGSGEQPKPGYLYSNNVFDNAPEILKEKGKAIRVVQMDPKTYTTWHKTVQHDGPAVSVFQAEGVKRILGTVPIEPDGSIYFELPAGKSVYFEMLDENGMAIHVMRSFANVMPGETRGCFGCHESNLATKGNTPSKGMNMAMKKGPQKLTPPSWGAEESISYMRFVQPVLDKYCAECHQKPNTKAYETLNMICRPSTHPWRNNVLSRPGDVSPFCEPYYTMVTGACPWGGVKQRDEHNVPKNIAGLFIVEGYNKNDPANLATLPPYSAFSPVSRLIHNACSGEHHGVKVTGVDRERLIAWVDCNGPYLGDEEIRAMYDPASYSIENIPPVRPRVATAPVINRFDIRQDGDSEKVAGVPLKLFASEPFDGEILSAVYGAQGKYVDVTDKLKELLGDKRVGVLGRYNDVFGGDPINNVKKTLKVIVRFKDGRAMFYEFQENATVILSSK
ncbi:MAG: PD40 domain-containing protein [Thermoguttaceae bacterium]|nr:PD40 domain-containing protein [Thermoguttaceae bacterium]